MKKVAYVARRVRLLQELQSERVVNMLKVKGIDNPADMLTKHLVVAEFKRYAARIYNCKVSEL